MKFFFFLFLFLSLLVGPLAHAKKIQIIHTNDLHSYFDGTRNALGGYAQIRAKIEKLKDEANALGIQTLVVDGGDFGEGTSFYASDRGVDSFKSLDLLGIDAAVIGNHDYLLGPNTLSLQLKKANLRAQILAANIENKKKLQINDYVKDAADFNLDELTIRIIGLTTNELHYSYALKPSGKISSPIKKGIRLSNKARQDKVDFVIALTHIGLEKDQELAKKSRHIDLIVGGHSHTRLEKPIMQKNKSGTNIPIVQAGANGLALGTIIIELQKNKKPRLVSYKLHDISKAMPKDKKVENFVERAKEKRNEFFGRRFDEVIGISNIKLSGYFNGDIREGQTCWSTHVARITRDAVKADLGLQIDSFQGEEIPAGKITYGDIIDNFPHFRSFDELGWRISITRINGFILKEVLKIIKKFPDAKWVTIAGLKENKNFKSFNFLQDDLSQALVSNQKIDNAKIYTLAFPDEIAFAIEKHSKFLRELLMPHLKRTDVFLWPEVEKYIANNSPLDCPTRE